RVRALSWLTSTRWGRVSLTGAFLLAAGCAPGGCGAPPAPPLPRELTFNCSALPQLWQVPADVGVATFDLYGAQGGDSSTRTGGLGGEAKAVLPATPGSFIGIKVGCRGNTPGNGGLGGVGDGFG